MTDSTAGRSFLERVDGEDIGVFGGAEYLRSNTVVPNQLTMMGLEIAVP